MRLLHSILLVLLAVPMSGEVCRFRAGDAENPFRRWLSFDEVTCVAETAMTLPPGLWNVFAREEGKALSVPIVIDGAKAQTTPPLSLEPAAQLSLLLPPGQRGLVYAPRRNTAVPIAAGAQYATVPAGEKLWLFVLDKRSIAAVFPIAALEAGSERAVDARTGGLTSAVVGWLQMPEEDRATLRDAHSVASPHVRWVGAGPVLDSDPLPPPESLNGSFVLVRGVSAGDAELRVEGQGWLPHAVRVKVGDRPITVEDRPLLARGAATLLVSWSSANDLVKLDASLDTCGGNADSAAQVEITIAACATPETCKVTRQESFVPQVPYGSFAVDDIAPGSYRAEMRFGKLPPANAMVDVPPFQQKRVIISAAYSTVYGSLTYGGKPLDNDARLAFPADGVGFASQETGEYRAVLPEALTEEDASDLPIDIVTCDERLRTFVLTDRPLRDRSRYDIDIPDNTLIVRVTDTFTQMALRGSTLRLVVMSGGVVHKPVVERMLKNEDQPEFVVQSVPEREILLRVSHPGYQEQRLRPFTMPKSGEKIVDVQLVPLRGSTGRIVSAKPFDDGTVIWLSAIGAQTERAELAPDGTFVAANAHAQDETVAVVSLSHPLWIVRMPALAKGQELNLRFPDGAPIRTFSVLLRGPDQRAAHFVGLVIGGILVPQEALRSHQSLRELPTGVHVSRLMPIHDIAETGPIDVLLGPAFNEVPSRGRSFDPLLLPQSADAPRQRLVPEMTQIVFEK